MRMMVAWKLSQGFGIGVWLRVGLHVALLALGSERYGQGKPRPAIDAWRGLMRRSKHSAIAANLGTLHVSDVSRRKVSIMTFPYR
jgi:radical SAM superfamily enzyme with C-terminal helix-hairpin-helix motif